MAPSPLQHRQAETQPAEAAAPAPVADEELLAAALRRFAAPPPRTSAWTFRLAALGFILGAAAFVMEAISLSRGVGWGGTEPTRPALAAVPTPLEPAVSPPTSPPLPLEASGQSTSPPPPAAPTRASNASAEEPRSATAPMKMLEAADETVVQRPSASATQPATFQVLWGDAGRANRSAADKTGAAEAAGAAAQAAQAAQTTAASAQGDSADDETPAIQAVPRGEQPNLLLMVADDLAAGDVAEYRKAQGQAAHALTPNIDGLARKGVLFMQAHSVAPLCTPSRFALLTGVPPACAALRAADDPPPAASAAPPLVSHESTLRPERHRALPHQLSALGYTTGLVGLWHLGAPEAEEAPKKKLQRQVRDALPAKWTVAAGGKVKRAVLDAYAEAQAHARRAGGFQVVERLYSSPLDSEALLLPQAMKVHNIEWIADGAAQFIQKHGAPAAPPFFLYVGWTLPHGPDAGTGLRADAAAFTPAGMWKRTDSLSQQTQTTRAEVRKRAKEGEKGKGQGKGGGGAAFAEGWQGHKSYGLALAWLDRGVGTVLWALQRRGVAHTTLAIFTADSGTVDKGHCYSQATRTPLLVQWPQRLAAGVRATALVSSLDLAPTLLDAATGAQPPPRGGARRAAPAVQLGGGGVSLLPLLSAAEASKPLHTPLHSHVLCEMGHTRSVLTSEHRYLFAPPQPGGKKNTFGADERHPAYHAEEQMYDARADPAETKELIVALGLRDAIPKNATAAGALQSMQRLLQQSLAQLSWNGSCAALKGW